MRILDVKREGFLFSVKPEYKQLFCARERVFNKFLKRKEVRLTPFHVYHKGKCYVGLNALFALIKRHPLLTMKNISKRVEDYQKLQFLNSELGLRVPLRDYQYEALKSLMNVRGGLVRLPTGSGKSYVEAALAICCLEFGSVAIFVPKKTIYKEIQLILDKFELPWRDYQKSRGDFTGENTVYLTTPITILNDFNKHDNAEIRNSINFAIWDECHHLSCKSWTKTLLGLPKLSRSFAFSATPFESDMDFSAFDQISINDAIVLSNSGELCYSKEPKNLGKDIDSPYVLNIEYDWLSLSDEEQKEVDWRKVSKIKDENDDRNKLIVDLAKKFSQDGRTTLIPVYTKEMGNQLLKDCKLNGEAICWFGNEEIFDSKGNEISQNDAREHVDSGKIKVVIATSHMYEGASLPEISTLILHEGRSDRGQIQISGRLTRLGKKKSIIVNIMDRGQVVLDSQARNRSKVVSEYFDLKPSFYQNKDDLLNSLIGI